MKRKLFFREFMEKKGIVVFLAVVLTASFVLSGMEYVLFDASIDNGYRPDVFLHGTTARSVYTYYDDTEDALAYINSHAGDAIRAVPCVTRNIISCTEKNGYNTVNYTVKGYSPDYIRESLSGYLAEGRMPEQGSREIAVGSRFAKVMQLSVGDRIEGQTVQIGTIGEISLFAALEESPDIEHLEPYTVCGIISDKCTFLEYAAVAANGANVKPNTVELFFRSDQAQTAYRKLLDEMPDGMIGGVEEFYAAKREKTVSLLLHAASIASAILMIIYLVISLLLKGLNRKLSVMKAVGVTDQYIVSSFFGGFAALIVLSALVAAGLVMLLVLFMNRQYAEFMGADFQKFRTDFMLILVLFGMGLFISLNLLAILRYKIARVNPKIDL